MSGTFNVQDAAIQNMPNYEYKCDYCGISREVYYELDEDKLNPNCCNKTMVRVWGSVATIFKGSGFYKTDNK